MARIAIVEPQNLLQYSEQFEQGSAWTLTNATIAAAAQADPLNGLLTSEALIANAVSGAHALSGSFTSGASQIAFSIYAKQANAGLPVILLSVPGVFAGGSGSYYDLSNGTKTDFFATPLTSTITPVGGGWYRCSIQGVAPPSTFSTPTLFICPSVGVTTFAGDGVTPSMYLFGAQVTTTSAPIPYTQSLSSAVNPTGNPRNVAAGRVPVSGRVAASGRVTP